MTYLLKITIIFFAFLQINNVHSETKVYFGTLHAHSNLSDGLKSISATKAYQYAKEKGNLDFMSLSEHNHMLEKNEMKQLIAISKEQTTKDFIALFGQEYSTIKKGFNHTNIQNYPQVLPRNLNGQYKKVFGVILPSFKTSNPDTTIFAGFNHPKKISTDYGLQNDYNGNWAEFIADLDPFVQLIAIGSGPADANNKKRTVNDTNDLNHTNFKYVNRWLDYLSHGMHLAPKVDHDSHSLTYGKAIAGRTGVWLDTPLTKQNLLTAISNRHVYAVEDSNLTIIPKLNIDYMLGDIVTSLEEDVLEIKLDISDADEPNAKYTVKLLTGITGSGQRAAVIKKLNKIKPGNIKFLIDIEKNIPSYYLIHVIQHSIDPENNSKTNDAWLAPIWFDWEIDDDTVNTEKFKFSGSRKSKIYHYPNCQIVDNIKASNLIQYTKKPDTKRLHKHCPF